LFRFIAEKSPAVLKLGLIFAGVAAAAGPLLLIVGQILPVITSLGASISAAGGAVALFSNPIGWAVLAVGGLIAMTTALWTELKPLRDMIGGHLTRAVQMLLPVWDQLKLLFAASWTMIKQLVMALAPLAEMFGATFGEGNLTGLQMFTAGLTMTLSVVTKMVTWFTVLVGWVEKLTKGLNDIVGPSIRLGNSWIAKAAGGIASGAGWVADAIGGGDNAAKLGLAGGPAGARDAGTAAVRAQAPQNGKNGEVIVRLPNMPEGTTVQAQGVQVEADNGQILATGF
jgi:hypothetical protein